MPRVAAIPVFLLLAGLSAAAGDTRIADAAEDGDTASVRTLLRQKADVNGAQGEGTTALHWAASRGDSEMVELLLQAGARVNAATRIGGITPLLMAAGIGNSPVVEKLLRAGADANARNSVSGATALMRAAASGDARTVQLLIEHGADANAKEPGRGQTALMFAAAADRPAAIRMLASRGADPGITSTVTVLKDATPVYDENGFPLDAELILRANLPPGEEAAKAALAGRRASATVSGGMTALLIAARDGRTETARALLESGADVNQVSAGDQSSPLVMALINGHFDLAMYLIGRGANPKLANKDGLEALYATIDAQWAPIGGGPVPVTGGEKASYLDLMKALLDHAANPNARLRKKLWYRPMDHDQMWVGTPGSTAFWRAAQATDLAAMRRLAARGADPKIPSDEGDTAMMMAAGVGWSGNFSRNAPDSALDAVSYCVELGLDVNTQDVTGYTALGGAAWRGDNALVNYLAAKGAKLDVRTHRGWSVTDMATGPYLRTTGGSAHPDTVELLLKLGAPELTPHPDEDVLGAIRRPAQKADKPR